MFSFLTKPYPFIGDIKRAIINNFFIGLFVAFFLIFFQPFQINEWQTDYKIIKLAGFGFISFLVPSLINFIILAWLRFWPIDKTWTIFKEVLTIVTILLSITCGNLVYSKLLFNMHLGLFTFINAFGITCLVGVFPVILHVILKHNKLLKINLQQTLEINEQLQLKQQNEIPEAKLKTNSDSTVEPVLNNMEIKLVSENEKDFILLKLAQLIYIESADNYSNVVYLDEKENKKKLLLRSSLKRIESQIHQTTVLRCHRTYIVNLNMVNQVEGNAAGYKLYLNFCEETLPVSRNYIPLIGEKLKHLQ